MKIKFLILLHPSPKGWDARQSQMPTLYGDGDQQLYGLAHARHSLYKMSCISLAQEFIIYNKIYFNKRHLNLLNTEGLLNINLGFRIDLSNEFCFCDKILLSLKLES